MIRKDGKTMRRLRKLRLAFNKPALAENSGVTLPLQVKGLSPALQRAIYLDPYEAHERGVIERKLADDDIVLELGAGIGFISTLCAKRIGGERVVAVEANPIMADAIRETYRLNGVKPQLFCGLLGKGEGEETFYVESNFISSSTHQRSQTAQAVTTQRYDARSFIERIKPTFLICDIEGGEQELLAYMPLDAVRKLCIELHPHVIGNAGTSAIFKRLLEQGFVCDFLNSSGKVYFFERTTD